MKLPAGWYIVLQSREVQRGAKKPLGFKRFGIELVAWRDSRGDVAILSDLCPHRSARLSLGRINGDRVSCPFHGFEFGTRGECEHMPETGKGAPNYCAPAFKTREEKGWIWMWWGEKPAIFPPLPWFKDWDAPPVRSGFTDDWATHFSRSVENQLDYAHLPFVHKSSIGRLSNPRRQPQFELDDQRIRFSFSARTYIEFIFPNLWINHISPKMAITMAFAPVDEGHTRLYLCTHRAFATWPPLSWLVGPAMNLANWIVLRQDHDVVMSQKPLDVREAGHERFVGSDRAIRHFRDWLERF